MFKQIIWPIAWNQLVKKNNSVYTIAIFHVHWAFEPSTPLKPIPQLYGFHGIFIIFRGEGEGDEGEGRRSFHTLKEDHSHGGGGRS